MLGDKITSNVTFCECFQAGNARTKPIASHVLVRLLGLSIFCQLPGPVGGFRRATYAIAWAR
jgi:hypothetical protein